MKIEKTIESAMELIKVNEEKKRKAKELEKSKKNPFDLYVKNVYNPFIDKIKLNRAPESSLKDKKDTYDEIVIENAYVFEYENKPIDIALTHSDDRATIQIGNKKQTVSLSEIQTIDGQILMGWFYDALQDIINF